jgi:hypothetical protein
LVQFGWLSGNRAVLALKQRRERVVGLVGRGGIRVVVAVDHHNSALSWERMPWRS